MMDRNVPTRWLHWLAGLVLLAACAGGADAPVAPTEPTPPAPVAALTVSVRATRLFVADTAQLVVTPVDAVGAALSGRTVAFAVSGETVATVSPTGLVTALGAGTATVMATVEGRQFAIGLVVLARPAAGSLRVEREGGDAQIGVTAQALADSLAVRVVDATGAPQAGIPVAWTADGGAVRPSTSITDGRGVAVAQWVLPPAAGAATARASVVAQTPASFAARSVAPTPCAVNSDVRAGRAHEGPTDYGLFYRPTGTLRGIMLFVDFGDAPATETTTALYVSLVGPAVDWFREVTYGQLTLDVTPAPKWYRMSKTSSAYGFAGRAVTFVDQQAYIAEAVALAARDVDFTRYSHVYIVASNGAQIPYSPAYVAYPGFGVTVQGTELRFGATFGRDVRDRVAQPDYGAHIFEHETAHTFGLPDLYSLAPVANFYDSFAGVGGWDIMSSTVTGAGLLAWHKQKNGWLASGQILCLDGASAEAIIAPIEVPGGVKAVMARIDESRAYVAEVRALTGVDARLCDAGVLVYRVDGTISTGDYPIVVQPAGRGTDYARTLSCFPLYDAPFGVGPDRSSRFVDAAAGVSIEVVSESGGSYRVRVRASRPSTAMLDVPTRAVVRAYH